LPGLALILALTLHLSAAVLLPSFLVLVAWALVWRERRRASLIDLAICAVVFLALHVAFVRFWDYSLLSSFIDVSGRALSQSGDIDPDYATSLAHIRDFLNEQFLIGPLALFAFLPAAVVALKRKDRRSIATVFLLTLGLAYLVASWMAGDSNLGYARNWDLLAPAGVCFTAAAMCLLVKHVPPSVRTGRLLALGFAVSILHLAPWVWINHNEHLALERFKTLPLGHGRTEVVVANYHLRRAEYGESAKWLQKAVRVNPRNANAYNLLASVYIERNDYERAREAYARAVSLRPDKIEFHNNYAFLLMQMKRHEEVLPELRWLVDRAPDKLLYWRSLREALLATHRYDELVPVNERLLALYDEHLARGPGDATLYIDSGIVLGDLDRIDEALDRFARALEIDPGSAAALFNTAAALSRAGRDGEARPYLERFLQLHPDHPMAAEARGRLGVATE
jgi:tetratricopeptide (TPR) repeat protein